MCKKSLKLEPKTPYLGIFGLEFCKSYYHVSFLHSNILENAKFPAKQKNLKFFGPKIFSWVYLGKNTKKEKQQKNKLLPHLKSALLKLLDCKVSCKKIKVLNLDQKCLIWLFSGWNFKKLLSPLKSTLSIFFKIQSFFQNKNILNLWPKIYFIGV